MTSLAQTLREQFTTNQQQIAGHQREVERLSAEQLKLIGKLELLAEQEANEETSGAVA